MGFTPQFKLSDITKRIGQEVEYMGTIIEVNLNKIGLEFVRNARSKVGNEEYRKAIGGLSYAKGERRAVLEEGSPGFNDRTGNLRSSIGYLIMKDGELVTDDFEESQRGTDKTTGRSKGLEYAKEVSVSMKGYLLVVVAGMEYAMYVEGLGYDVITGSSLIAEKSLKDAIKTMSEL